ncbi:hypothetical protein N9L68_09170 [bacterium]|nr:hypothetical protein [bacterium]
MAKVREYAAVLFGTPLRAGDGDGGGDGDGDGYCDFYNSSSSKY